MKNNTVKLIKYSMLIATSTAMHASASNFVRSTVDGINNRSTSSPASAEVRINKNSASSSAAEQIRFLSVNDIEKGIQLAETQIKAQLKKENSNAVRVLVLGTTGTGKSHGLRINGI